MATTVFSPPEKSFHFFIGYDYRLKLTLTVRQFLYLITSLIFSEIFLNLTSAFPWLTKNPKISMNYFSNLYVVWVKYNSL